MSGWSKVSWDSSFLEIRVSSYLFNPNSLTFVPCHGLVMPTVINRLGVMYFKITLGCFSWKVIKESLLTFPHSKPAL